MAFLKAVQIEFPDDRAKYVEALIAYKAEAKRYHKARRTLKNSPVQLEQLEWYKAKDRFSLASRLFQQAREEFSRAQALHKLESRGIDIKELSLAKLVGIDVPMSLKDMLEETRRENAIVNVPPEELNKAIEDAKITGAMSQEEKLKYIASGKLLEDYLKTGDAPEVVTFGNVILGTREELESKEPEVAEIVESTGLFDSDEATCIICGKRYDSSIAMSNDCMKYCSKKCEKEE